MLPGWPVARDRITIQIPAGITLREDTEFLWICCEAKAYPLPANVGASVLSLIVEEIAEEMQAATELAPNGLTGLEQ